jgi:hypothetical protein
MPREGQMKPYFGLSIIPLILVAACGDQAAPSSNNASATDQPAPNSTEPAKAAATPAAPAPISYILAARGLEPGLPFGMKQDEAVAAAAAAFGAPTRRNHNDECGEGPMDFVDFHGLSLGFQDGRLAGWSLSETEPALRTAGGLAIGAPRSALGGAEVDEESTLGPEFEAEGIGGLLDEKGKKIEALWAGLACQFR